MLIHDDEYHWEGWGGKLKLASGRCRLRIFDLRQGRAKNAPAPLRPVIVVISELPKEKNFAMSMRSCAGHIATSVARDFGLDSQRMLFVEYYPEVIYGPQNQYRIGEKFEVVDFNWKQGQALEPKWRELKAPLLEVIRKLVHAPEAS
jgi:hypothetical protein